jgi:hypothetical protein
MSKPKLVFVLAGLVAAAGVAVADSPHFLCNRTDANLNNDGSLVVSWKEAGLGSNQNIDYLAGAQAEAVCTCVTRSNKCPNAANKVTTSGQVSAEGTFNSGKNGSITASLTVEPPACPSSDPPTCGGGQHLVVSAISYTDISLTDTTNNVSPDAGCLPTSLSKVFFECP